MNFHFGAATESTRVDQEAGAAEPWNSSCIKGVIIIDLYEMLNMQQIFHTLNK